MTRREMVKLIRRSVEVRGNPPSLITVQLGMDAGTSRETAKAVLHEALLGLPRGG